MKKIILLISIISLSLTVKSQCFTAQIDTSMGFGQAIGVGNAQGMSDTGYFQPTSFNLILKNLSWQGFRQSDGCTVFVPKSVFVNGPIAVYIYLFQQSSIYVANKYHN